MKCLKCGCAYTPEGPQLCSECLPRAQPVAESTADRIARAICGAKETKIDKAEYHNGSCGIALGILVIILTSDGSAYLIFDGVPDAVPNETLLSSTVAELARTAWERKKGEQG